MTLAIATSSRATAVQEKRNRHEELFKRNQTVVCGDDPTVKKGKPAPNIY